MTSLFRENLLLLPEKSHTPTQASFSGAARKERDANTKSHTPTSRFPAQFSISPVSSDSDSDDAPIARPTPRKLCSLRERLASFRSGKLQVSSFHSSSVGSKQTNVPPLKHGGKDDVIVISSDDDDNGSANFRNSAPRSTPKLSPKSSPKSSSKSHSVHAIFRKMIFGSSHKGKPSGSSLSRMKPKETDPLSDQNNDSDSSSCIFSTSSSNDEKASSGRKPRSKEGFSSGEDHSEDSDDSLSCLSIDEEQPCSRETRSKAPARRLGDKMKQNPTASTPTGASSNGVTSVDTPRYEM